MRWRLSARCLLLIPLTITISAASALALEPMEPASVCERISTSRGEAECLRIIDGQYVDYLAAAACNRIPTNGATIACMRAIAGRRLSHRLIAFCDAESGSWETVRCFESDGVDADSAAPEQSASGYADPVGRPYGSPRRPAPRPENQGTASCNAYGCWRNGGGCNAYGCWNSPYGSCNAYGCSNYGGCNAYGCWKTRSGSCNAYGCSEIGVCTAYGCPH